MMDCFNNPKISIHNYCEVCKMLVNFTYELYFVVENYLDNGGDFELLEGVYVDVYINLFREACKNWCLNIDDLEMKQLQVNDINTTLITLICNIPKDKNERILFIEQQSGYAVIQISKEPWFQNIYLNILESIKLKYY